MSEKSLKEREKNLLRTRLQKLVEEEFGGKPTHAAHALGVSQPYLSDVLAGRRSGGIKLLRGYAAYTGQNPITLEPDSDPDERYPNRQRGARAASIVLSISLAEARQLAPEALHSEHDPDPLWWFSQIVSAHELRMKRYRGRDVVHQDLD